MKQYMLSVCYPPGSAPPSPAELETIMRDVMSVQREMQATRRRESAGEQR